MRRLVWLVSALAAFAILRSLALPIALPLHFASVSLSAPQADVIYQAFNVPFRQLQAQLPKLQKLGYTYIQVSPPQKSNPTQDW